MADDVIFSLDAEGEGTVAVIDQIDEALQTLSDSITAVADSAGDFSALDDAMAMLSQMTAEGAAQAAALDDALTTAAEGAATAAAEVDTLNASLDTAAASAGEAAASADTAAGSIDAMGASADGASGAFDGLEGATGKLMMVGAVAAVAGGKFLGMGLDGQKGEALLRGMAGASQQDIQALQDDAQKLGENMTDASAGFYEVESAGYAGSDAIKVFDAASRLAEGGQARQQDTMSALTAVMHDYNANADQATQYTDYMAEAIVRGKQSAQDFASSIGPLASAGQNVGLGFNQVAAAEATMTQINPKVAQDSQQLTSLFNFLSPTMGGVANAAKGLGLAFNEQKYNSEDLLGKLQYLSDIAGGTNTAAFVKLTGGVRGSTAAIDLLKNGASAFQANLDAMGHSAGATAQAFDQYENTVPAHLDKAGAAVSIFSTKLMDALGPKITPVIDHITTGITNFSNVVLQHLDLVGPVLAGLAAVIVGALVPAVVAFVISAAPVIAILLLIGAAVGGIVYVFTHWTQTLHFVNDALKIPAIHEIMSVLQRIGAFLVSTFTPVWQQLVNVFNSQIKPAFAQLMGTFHQLQPEFQMLGMLIGGIVVVALGLLVGSIGGVIKALAGFLTGLATIIGGAVQMLTGMIQIISGIIAFIVDLVTGHFDKLGADLGVIWQGITNIFEGAWKMIVGVFQAVIGFITGLVSGFIEGIVGFFQNLADTLVGHSIIPDMINAIVDIFTAFPDQAMAGVNSLISQITSTLGNLGSQALGWAQDMISGFVQGIQNGVGAVGNAVSGIANAVSSFLHHSKPDIGPLANDDQWMPDMIAQMAEGITNNQGRLKDAMSGLATQMSIGIAPTGTIAPPITGGGASDQTLQSQILSVLNQILNQLKSGSQGGNASVTFNGVQGSALSSQQLNQLVQALSGYQYESTARGAY